jgi:uncharacterized protein YbaA (DUF1428 family)
LLPMAKDNVDKYKELAQKAGEIWKEHGALEYYECAGDDLAIEKMVSFKKSADASEDETVIFAWIVFESKEQRDKINAAVMEDSRLKEMMDSHSSLFDY